jgi:hypothetical protein
MFAAFDQSEIHRVEGRGSKILLSEVCLLPWVLEGFIHQAEWAHPN